VRLGPDKRELESGGEAAFHLAHLGSPKGERGERGLWEDSTEVQGGPTMLRGRRFKSPGADVACDVKRGEKAVQALTFVAMRFSEWVFYDIAGTQGVMVGKPSVLFHLRWKGRKRSFGVVGGGGQPSSSED